MTPLGSAYVGTDPIRDGARLEIVKYVQRKTANSGLSFCAAMLSWLGVSSPAPSKIR